MLALLLSFSLEYVEMCASKLFIYEPLPYLKYYSNTFEYSHGIQLTKCVTIVSIFTMQINLKSSGVRKKLSVVLIFKFNTG